MSRQRLVEALVGLEQAMANLRGVLQANERANRQSVRRIEQGDPLPEVLRAVDIAPLRRELAAAFTACERANQEARVAFFDELHRAGMNITEIAQLFGLSHQLVSRIMNKHLLAREPGG